MALRYWLATVGLVGLCARAELVAQGIATTRSVRQANSSAVGSRVLIAGRVLLGSGVLDSARLTIIVEDSSGSVRVEAPVQAPGLPLAPGDSVWAAGVVNRNASRIFVDRAVVTRVSGSRIKPEPLPLDALTPSSLAGALSRLIIVDGTVVALGRNGRESLLTIRDTVTDGNFVTVVKDADGNVPLGFERFSVGDRVRVTGVLIKRMSPHTGILRYAILPRDASDLQPTGMTARTRTAIVHGSAFATMTLLLLGFVLYLRARTASQQDAMRRAGEEIAKGYRSLLEQAPIGIAVHDERHIVYANAAFVALVGAPTAEALSATCFSDFVHVPTAERAGRNGASLAIGTGMDGPMRLKRLDGQVIDVEIAESRIEYGGRRCAQLVVHDVSERIRAQQAVAEGEARLRQSQKLEAVGQLAGGVAHDFNNILTIIKGNAALLIEGCAACHAVAEEARDIDQAADRGAALTRQLLAFSRKQIIKPTALEVDSLVRNLERMLRRLVPENVEQRLSLNAPRSFVLADAGQLEQVIMNLAVNARDAMPMGGVLAIRTTNVVVSDEMRDSAEGFDEMRPGNYVCIAISDTGVGMDEETRRRAFDPFFTTKEPGKGTGLGLATVYGIAKQNNGFVFIASMKGMGTTVRLYLPRVGAATREAVHVAPEAVARGAETVLLVEDEPTIRKLAGRVLRAQGYRVLEAATGMDAISLVQKDGGVIDLLVTDVIMPGLSGQELATHLCRERPGLRVLFMSGYTDDHLADHGVLRSDVELLHKPFAPDELLRRVRLILKGGAIEVH